MEDKEKVMEQLVLALDKAGSVDSAAWAAEHKLDHQVVVGALKSLSTKEVVLMEQFDINDTILTEEGQQYVELGSPEARLWHLVTKPMPNADAEAAMNDKELFKIAMMNAMKSGWIKVNKNADKSTSLERKADSIVDTVQSQLKMVAAKETEKLAKADNENLKRRKLITPVVVKAYKVTKGPKFSLTEWNKKLETDFTHEMLESGAWQTAEFKEFNFNSLGVAPQGGHLHPLLKVRAEFRQIFLELGFEEMPTNNWVESSFWNFDALFQPQSHPARDAHDTFFIASPAETREIEPEYLEAVKKIHSEGGFNSIGYRYKWEEKEARKNLLRTHTTAVSARMLAALAKQKEFTPKKYFSIDRVFRNEAMDATHLAEFHQIEGLIADRNITLQHLMGSIAEFFKKLGMTDLRFKPAYNPYTEPSMEIFAFHPLLKRWVEIGNSGMFRPEMLRPMGLPEDVRVIAWGLSLERPTMIKYGLRDIRDLVGHKIDINWVKNNPICRIDK